MRSALEVHLDAGFSLPPIYAPEWYRQHERLKGFAQIGYIHLFSTTDELAAGTPADAFRDGPFSNRHARSGDPVRRHQASDESGG